MRIIFVVGAIFGLYLTAFAEARFQVLHENKWYDVELTKSDVPFILIDGKKVSAYKDGMRLAQVGNNRDLMQRSPKWAYLDIVSSASQGTALEVNGASSLVNNSLNLQFRVESLAPLNNAFAVVFLECRDGQRGYIVRTVGKVRAFKPEIIDFSSSLNESIAGAHFIFCLFADGKEVRQSMSKEADFSYGIGSGALERAVKEQTKQPLVYWSYPPRGLSKGISKVSLQIEYSSTGSVERAKVLSEMKDADRDIVETAVVHWWIVPVAIENRTYAGRVRCEIDVADLSKWDSAAIQLNKIESTTENK